MPNFKPKSNKRIKYNKKSAVTLDGKHKEFLNEFSRYDHDKIPSLKKEITELKARLEKEDTSLSLEEKLDFKDAIKDMKR